MSYTFPRGHLVYLGYHVNLLSRVGYAINVTKDP